MLLFAAVIRFPVGVVFSESPDAVSLMQHSDIYSSAWLRAVHFLPFPIYKRLGTTMFQKHFSLPWSNT